LPRHVPAGVLGVFASGIHAVTVGSAAADAATSLGSRPRRTAAVTLDTYTTVHTMFGNQMGGRKSYNPKNKKSYSRS